MSVAFGIMTVMAINFFIGISSMSPGKKQGVRLVVLGIALALGFYWVRSQTLAAGN